MWIACVWGLLLICLSYWFALSVIRAWSSEAEVHLLPESSLPFITVIVPVRNEVNTIQNCIDDLISQDYPQGRREFFIVNDHSDDGTESYLSLLNDCHGVTVLHLPKGRQGKKQALALALEKARGSLIVQTDADCRLSPSWLRGLVSIAESNDLDALCGLLCLKTAQGGWLSLFQEMDNAGTMAVENWGLNKNLVPLGSAANMLYRKDVAYSNHGERSGDDVFLLEKVALTGGRLGFTYERPVRVWTKAQDSWKDLIHQRMRWAEKSGSYRHMGLHLLGAAYLAYYLTIVLYFFLGFWFLPYLYGALLLLLSFSVCQHIVFRKVQQETELCYRWYHLPLFTLTQMCLYLGLAVTVLLGLRSTWKGRKT